jgi:hypothetical protein
VTGLWNRLEVVDDSADAIEDLEEEKEGNELRIALNLLEDGKAFAPENVRVLFAPIAGRFVEVALDFAGASLPFGSLDNANESSGAEE